jgi:Pregnancy-associated plasma protein-A/Secretion system C-terminal sorting domain
MRTRIVQLVSAACIIGLPLKSFGQEGRSATKTIFCGSSEYEAVQQKNNQDRATTAAFEAWLAPKVAAIKNRRTQRQAQNTNDIFSIPVVVHVIHNGDAIGAGENISDAQILSQITVLNQDYGKIAGTPGFNTNPVGADTGVTFCLAQRDPDGVATSGIVRHYYSNTAWDVNSIEQTIKPQTQWDPDIYMNIWVVSDITFEIFGMQIPGIKGYAQFPSMSGLEGLDGEQDMAGLSGVVIGHKYFGSPQVYPGGTYDSDDVRGRTASHEIGHFFGLRHIWGDGDCTVDDFCADTPEAAEATDGECPSGQDSCPDSPGLDMVENYMDYSSEGCMNIFTTDQKYRIMAVLENSPRRASLTTSTACAAAEEHLNDGSLHIDEVEVVTCSNTFAPVLRIFNSGTAALTSATVNYYIDNQPAATYNWAGSLQHLQDNSITLPVLSAVPGSHVLHAAITSVNGTTDESTFNNTRSYAFKIAPNLDITEVTVEVKQDVFGSETTWELTDSDGGVVASGGPYEDIMDPNAEMPVHTATVALAGNECYTFTIEDSGGNGLAGMLGQGHYLLTSSGSTIGQGGFFGDSDSVSFAANLILANHETPGLHGIRLYPVPSADIITIIVPENLAPGTYSIFNNLGQVVKTAEISSGVNVNISGLPQGTYYVKISSGSEYTVLPFIKNSF